MIRLFMAVLLLAATLSSANAVELKGNLIQGGLVVGQTMSGAAVTLDGKPIGILANGRFVIGFGRDQKPRALLDIKFPDGTTASQTIKIQQRRYFTQNIKGLPHKKVTPDPADVKRIRADNAKIRNVRNKATVSKSFESGFLWPVRAQLSSVFGSQRILNGVPKRPHNGVDIAGSENTVVLAAADGRVAVADSTMFLSGKTVILDHGLGLTSAYIHMSKILVKAGEYVKKGTPIGAIGHSGRVTGPHLHWGVHWFQEPLDPALLAGPLNL